MFPFRQKYRQGEIVSFGDQVRQSFSRISGAGNSVEGSAALRSPASLAAENQRLRETTLELLETLGAVVDALSPYTLYHSTQVAMYALELARALQLRESEQELIFRAGLVHDVGMISLSSAAIAKEGKLTEEEVQYLRMHPTIGCEIVGRIQHLSELTPLVHYHHERYDGKGYPDRLKGEEIPLGARILCLADSLDAMLTERPGREGMDLFDVLFEIKQCSGTQFDPQVVRALFIVVDEKPDNYFHSSNLNAGTDMLLSTVGIGSGRVRNLLAK